MKKITELDEKLFLKIYSLGSRYKIIGKIGAAGTRLSYYIFFLLYALGVLYVFLTNAKMLFKFIAVPAAALLINTILRKGFKRERPMNKLNIKSRIGHKETNSFPSNHSASAMVIAVSFMAINLSFGLCLLPFVFLTGLSRIISGVHFPLDVAGGILAGGLIGYIGFFIL